MNKHIETFPFSPAINLAEEGKWQLAVTSCEAMNSVFQRTDENNNFPIGILSCWNSEDGGELINKLNIFFRTEI